MRGYRSIALALSVPHRHRVLACCRQHCCAWKLGWVDD